MYIYIYICNYIYIYVYIYIYICTSICMYPVFMLPGIPAASTEGPCPAPLSWNYGAIGWHYL